MAFFIPWRVVAENSGAAQLGRRDACSTCSGRRSGCWPQKSPRQRRRFVLVLFRFGATLELGRSERTTMRPLWRYGVDAANTPDRKAALTSPTSCSLSDISGWRAGVLYPLAGGGRESGAAQLGRRDACSTCSGRRSGCWPRGRRAASPVPFWCYSGSGRRWSSGDRSERRCGRCGGTGSTLPTPLIESRVD